VQKLIENSQEKTLYVCHLSMDEYFVVVKSVFLLFVIENKINYS